MAILEKGGLYISWHWHLMLSFAKRRKKEKNLFPFPCLILWVKGREKEEEAKGWKVGKRKILCPAVSSLSAILLSMSGLGNLGGTGHFALPLSQCINMAPMPPTLITHVLGCLVCAKYSFYFLPHISNRQECCHHWRNWSSGPPGPEEPSCIFRIHSSRRVRATCYACWPDYDRQG